MYMSHFFNALLSFDEFSHIWSITPDEISLGEYTNIRWAIKEYMRSMSVKFLDINTAIKISSVTNGQDNGPVKGQKISELMTKFVSPDDLVSLKEWSITLYFIAPPITLNLTSLVIAQ